MTTKKTEAAATKTTAAPSDHKKSAVEKKPAAGLAVKALIGSTPEPTVKKSKKTHKNKVVRDSFTMPQDEYQKISEIKETCLKAGLPVKKSEVLRAGLKALGELNAAQLKHALAGLEKIRTGRPKKH